MVGFSDKINDPMYENYRKKARKWSFLFAIILAVVAIVGFVVYGEISGQIKMPHSLFYGLGIGALFIVIALLQEVKRKTDTTWDGVVVDKKILQKTERVRYGNKVKTVPYTLYVIKVKRDDGKIFTHSVRENRSIFDYYQVGDRVRHHKGFSYYEKYDKSKDSKILCVACLTFNDIHDDFCKKCKVPLLK
uniref:Zinc ribbon domain-containing protein n=1 Tax=Pseudothermotoga hypogea TaxID=57487 RepID=A0A832I7T5_9THEM